MCVSQSLGMQRHASEAGGKGRGIVTMHVRVRMLKLCMHVLCLVCR